MSKLFVRYLFFFVIGVFSCAFSVNLVFGDSLWTENTRSIYNSIQRVSVGDIITVKISNRSSAIHEAGTKTSKKSSVGANLYNLWDQCALDTSQNESLRKMQNYSLGGNDQYSGLGNTSRKSKVKAIMSAVVSEILSNGNLVVVGEHSVHINDEIEIIKISGVVRPQDISENNSIHSYQIAQAKISVRGDGVVGSKQTPGILTKLFNWVF